MASKIGSAPPYVLDKQTNIRIDKKKIVPQAHLMNFQAEQKRKKKQQTTNLNAFPLMFLYALLD